MELFLVPEQSARKQMIKNLPDGFEVIFKIPPQSNNLMNEEQKQMTVNSAKTTVLIEIILAIVLKSVM